MITNNEWTYLRPYINDKRVIEIGCGGIQALALVL